MPRLFRKENKTTTKKEKVMTPLLWSCICTAFALGFLSGVLYVKFIEKKKRKKWLTQPPDKADPEYQAQTMYRSWLKSMGII